MSRFFSVFTALATVLILNISLAVHASEVKEIQISGSGSKDFFGQSVSLSGDYAIAGAPGENAGRAYIFRYTGSGWEQSAMLSHPDSMPLPFAHFGSSVAVFDDTSKDSDEYAIAGAYYDDGKVQNSGAAYIFQRRESYWSHQSTLIAGDGQRNDYFGYSVSLWGDIALVGAYRSDAKGKDSGAVYIFKNNGGSWTQQSRLTASDGKAGDHFGRSVSVFGAYAIVGAFHQDDKGADSGAAYIFYNYGGTWTQKAKLLASDGAANDFFGFSVFISEKYAIVGAPGDDDGGDGAGAAYLFTYAGGNWTQSAKLKAGDSQIRALFGRSVSVSGEYASVGADGADSRSGAVYIFKNSGSFWVQQEKLTATGPSSGDRLGASVSLYSPSSSYFRVISGTGTAADADGMTEDIRFFGNEPEKSPSIDVSPKSLLLTTCISAGRESDREPPSAAGRSPDDTAGYGMGLIIPDEVKDYWQKNQDIPRPPRSPGLSALPPSKDWSEFDSSVKSQGSCGACSVFATAALVENLMNQENLPVPPDISEQALLSCVDGIDCGGGWYWDILKYISQFGAVPENCAPYNNKKGTCSDMCDSPEFTLKIANYTPTPAMWSENHSYDDLRMALQDGPLVVSMRVPDDGSFVGSGYQGGVYDYEGGTISWDTNGHAVLLVGYNDAEQSFKVKNSWGEQWGENGYFRIAYNDVADYVKFGGYACSASGAYLADRATVFTIANRGTADLKVSRIISDKYWLGVSSNSEMTILPMSEKSVVVSVSDWGIIPLSGTQAQISIESNDARNPVVTVSVIARTVDCPIPGPVNEGVTIGNIDCSTNNDGGSEIDLRDAILGLQILTGINAAGLCEGYPDSGTDVNGDKRVGLEEVMYILRQIAEF